MTDSRDPSPEALPTWVLYLLCGPAAALGVRLGFSMRALLDVMQLAIYRAIRDEGLSQREASERLGVSIRTIAEMSRATKDAFGAAEDAYELPRRIELLLWAQPLTMIRLVQALRTVEAERVEAAVAKLEAEGRIVGEGPSDRRRYRVTRDLSMFPAGSLLARLDGLKRFMGGVRRTVATRFFDDQTAKAGALNFDFRMRRADRARFERYREVLLDLIRGLDHAAVAEQQGDGAAEIERVHWSMFWLEEPEGGEGVEGGA